MHGRFAQVLDAELAQLRNVLEPYHLPSAFWVLHHSTAQHSTVQKLLHSTEGRGETHGDEMPKHSTQVPAAAAHVEHPAPGLQIVIQRLGGIGMHVRRGYRCVEPYSLPSITVM